MSQNFSNTIFDDFPKNMVGLPKYLFLQWINLMAYIEYMGNMHMHTPYSDGEATHAQIADAALAANLDFVIVTDHNILVSGIEGYYGDSDHGYVLLLTGEEIHDRTRQPQVNHCLVYNAPQEMSQFATNPQKLIDEVNALKGLTFLAHPSDKRIAWRDSSSIAWVDWEISGYTGIEIWNYMSCFKDVIETPLKTMRRIFEPEKAVIGPRQATLELWDRLLATGQRVVGIGNSDAHGTVFRMGPIKHIIFPYDYLFNCVNTHILSASSFIGDVDHDANLIYTSLAKGHAFVSYQIVGKAKGFRFTAQDGRGGVAQMGESLRVGRGVTIQIIAPQRAHIKLICHGKVIASEKNVENLTKVVLQPGAYRVEVWKQFQGKERCWILSNPIYIEANRIQD